MTSCPHCKQPMKAVRSPADHRRFFGLIRATFHHWPEFHDFAPDNEEHLRKWLLCKAGYRDVTMIPVEFADDQPGLMRLITIAAESAVKAAGGYAFMRPHGDGIAVFAAKSIKWDTLDQKQFNAIRDAVESVIEAETGLKPDEILKQTHEAA